MQTITTDSTVTVRKIIEELRRLGFVEGAPPHIAPAIVDIDRRVYSRLRCGQCGHRGHKVQPMHRGSTYKLVCACRRCHNEMEA
jgi:hypothetical protein